MSNPHPDDFVPEDDAIIGKALKGSPAAVIVIAAAAGGIYLMQLEDEQPDGADRGREPRLPDRLGEQPADHLGAPSA